MSPVIIFIVGVFVTSLCLVFVYSTVSELRKGARKAEEMLARGEKPEPDPLS